MSVRGERDLALSNASEHLPPLLLCYDEIGRKSSEIFRRVMPKMGMSRRRVNRVLQRCHSGLAAIPFGSCRIAPLTRSDAR